MTALVSAANLSRRFGARGWFGGAAPVLAVSDVSLSLERGDALALVGESGSGKTTLGRMMLGLLQPTSGCVRFDGMDLASVNHGKRRELRRRMQIVFQDPQSSLDPRRVVGAQIRDGLTIHNVVPALMGGNLQRIYRWSPAQAE